MIKELSDSNIKDVVWLHLKILPDSIFSRFGGRFLEVFYQNIIESEDFFCKVYYFEGRPAGFLFYTSNRKTGFHKFLRKHFFKILKILIKRSILHAGCIKSLIQALFYLSTVRDNESSSSCSEIISFAVLPEFRVHAAREYSEFYLKYKIRIADDLFGSMLKHLKGLGVSQLRIMTPAANAASNRFYQKQGCIFSGQTMQAFGIKANIYKTEICKINRKD